MRLCYPAAALLLGTACVVKAASGVGYPCDPAHLCPNSLICVTALDAGLPGQDASAPDAGVAGQDAGATGSLDASSPSDAGSVVAEDAALADASAPDAGALARDAGSADATPVEPDASFDLDGSFPGLPTGIGWHSLGPATALDYNNKSVCPMNGFSNGTYTSSYGFHDHCHGVIEAQSGGVADTRRNLLYLAGGGHGDYSGNEVYKLDLNASPVTLTRVTDPTVPTASDDPNYDNQSSCVAALPQVTTVSPWTTCVPSSDGTGCSPNGVHSASGQLFVRHPTDPTRDAFLRAGGSLSCGPGNSTGAVWTTSLNGPMPGDPVWIQQDATSTWTGPVKLGNFEIYGDYDSTSNLAYFADSDGGFFGYDYFNNKWTKFANGVALEHNQNNAVIWHDANDTQRLFLTLGGCTANPIASISRSGGVATVTTSYAALGFVYAAPGGKVRVYGVTDSSFNSSDSFTIQTIAGAGLTYSQAGADATSSGGWVMSCQYGSADTYFGVGVTDVTSPLSPTTWTSWNTNTLANANVDTGDPSLGNTCAEFLRGGQAPLNGVDGNRAIGGKTPGLAFDPVTHTVLGWPNEGNSVYELTPDPANTRILCRRLDPPGIGVDAPAAMPSYKSGVNYTSWGSYRGHFDYWPGPGVFTMIQGPEQPARILRIR